MSIWEVINLSDNITLVTDKFDLACAAAMLIGTGQYSLKEVGGENREMPFFTFMPNDELQNWFIEHFPEVMKVGEGDSPYGRFLDSINKLELADVLRTVQVCSPAERESYQEALKAIDDPVKKQDYAEWWKNRRQMSLNDIPARAWAMAEKLESLYRQEVDHV